MFNKLRLEAREALDTVEAMPGAVRERIETALDASPHTWAWVLGAFVAGTIFGNMLAAWLV